MNSVEHDMRGNLGCLVAYYYSAMYTVAYYCEVLGDSPE